MEVGGGGIEGEGIGRDKWKEGRIRKVRGRKEEEA